MVPEVGMEEEEEEPLLETETESSISGFGIVLNYAFLLEALPCHPGVLLSEEPGQSFNPHHTSFSAFRGFFFLAFHHFPSFHHSLETL